MYVAVHEILNKVFMLVNMKQHYMSYDTALGRKMYSICS